MDKKYAILGTIWVLVIVAALITHSFFPGFVKEKTGLYQSYEYSQMYLENDPYTDVVIEYDYIEGYEPSETAMTLLEEKIEKYTEKENIDRDVDDKITANDTKLSYDENDISELKDAYKDHERLENTIPIHVLCLNGRWEKNPDVLGISKRPHQIVIFNDVIEEKSRNLEAERVEAAVLVHEFGHLLSLVELDYESDHEDKEYEGHCDESEGECVMAGYVDISEDTEEPPPIEFCELCKSDLEKIREMRDPFSFDKIISYTVISSQYFMGAWASTVLVDGVKRKRGSEKGYFSDDGAELRYRENEKKPPDGKSY
ncbi:MAG: hypothetical protein ACOCTN_01160 [Candidatus Natronoplasma sp.]